MLPVDGNRGDRAIRPVHDAVSGASAQREVWCGGWGGVHDFKILRLAVFKSIFNQVSPHFSQLFDWKRTGSGYGLALWRFQGPSGSSRLVWDESGFWFLLIGATYIWQSHPVVSGVAPFICYLESYLYLGFLKPSFFHLCTVWFSFSTSPGLQMKE